MAEALGWEVQLAWFSVLKWRASWIKLAVFLGVGVVRKLSKIDYAQRFPRDWGSNTVSGYYFSNHYCGLVVPGIPCPWPFFGARPEDHSGGWSDPKGGVEILLSSSFEPETFPDNGGAWRQVDQLAPWTRAPRVLRSSRWLKWFMVQWEEYLPHAYIILQ